MYNILICDDDKDIVAALKIYLGAEGYNLLEAYTGRQAIEVVEQEEIHLILMDIMMPELDGYSLCSSIRESSNVPIIIVSAKDSEMDRILGLNLGSDDYLTKPFSPMELVARIKSIFRRIELDKYSDNSGCIAAGDLNLYADRRMILCHDKPINFTTMEFNLMQYLILNKNRAVSREELLNRIWGFESVTGTRATDDMVKRIRAKLLESDSELTIETIWGFGFCLNVNE